MQTQTAKPTPGPWTAGNLSDGWSVLDASNNLIAFIGRDDMETGDNCQADAQFIAAAPELLAELSAAVGYMRNARIDLETGAPKATAIRTLDGGLKRAETALAKFRA